MRPGSEREQTAGNLWTVLYIVVIDHPAMRTFNAAFVAKSSNLSGPWSIMHVYM